MRWIFLWGSNFSNVILDGVDFYKVGLSGSVLDGASLRGVNLHRAQLDECEARGAIFSDANLVNYRLQEAVLAGADFRRSLLSGAHLWEADLTGADFRNANFGREDRGSRTLLENARLSGCKFDGAEGWAVGPADVGGEGAPHIIGGEELTLWFAKNGAPNLSVVE